MSDPPWLARYLAFAENARAYLGDEVHGPIAEALIQQVEILRDAIELGDLEEAIQAAYLAGSFAALLAPDVRTDRRTRHQSFKRRMWVDIRLHWLLAEVKERLPGARSLADACRSVVRAHRGDPDPPTFQALYKAYQRREKKLGQDVES
jgi:hypothetical protein